MILALGNTVVLKMSVFQCNISCHVDEVHRGASRIF